MDKFTNFIGDKYRNIASGFMTVLKESKFYEEGVLTPEEFISTGDYLVNKCPTWKWSSNKGNIQSADYLPKDKQFLITSVSCIERANKYSNSRIVDKLDNDGWTETIVEYEGGVLNDNHIEEVSDEVVNNSKRGSQVISNLKINDDYLNMGIEYIEDDENEKKIEDDKDIKNKENIEFIIDVVDEENEKCIKSRIYDVSITYDFYYRVPRMWLIGYSERGQLLTEDEIKEDIMLDYIDKTVTIEKHPNLGIRSASIHPCRHSLLLKKFISNYEKSGRKLEIEKSIILFLKFLSSVVPTIKYDFTLDLDI